MPKYHSISGGDSVESVAFDNGLYWPTVWDHPANATLRSLRKDQPNILQEGDQLFIPDVTAKEVEKTVDARYRFRRKGVPTQIKVRFTMHGDQPRADIGFSMTAGKHTSTGRTDADGWIQFSAMPDVRTGTLTLETGERYEFDIGTIRPASSIDGVQRRLRNLGNYDGPLDGTLNDALRVALRRFQAVCGLPVTGKPDRATVAEIESRHGS